jgi:hypothetical protein
MKHEVFEVGFWSRVRYSLKAFFSVLFNRPIVVYYDDEEMYARSNFMIMAQMATNMVQICEYIAEEHDTMKISLDSLSYSEERKN